MQVSLRARIIFYRAVAAIPQTYLISWSGAENKFLKRNWSKLFKINWNKAGLQKVFLESSGALKIIKKLV